MLLPVSFCVTVTTDPRTMISMVTVRLPPVTLILISSGETPSTRARFSMKAVWLKLSRVAAIVTSDVTTGRKASPGARGDGGLFGGVEGGGGDGAGGDKGGGTAGGGSKAVSNTLISLTDSRHTGGDGAARMISVTYGRSLRPPHQVMYGPPLGACRSDPHK